LVLQKKFIGDKITNQTVLYFSDYLLMAGKEKTYRFQDKGFDLDLSYITDRIIAFSSPVNIPNKTFKNSVENIARY
jgi:hypothetical protein